jgi:hypothetical protein
MNPFEFVNSISLNKRNLMRGTENDELAEKEYVSFLVNRSLSYFTDTLLYANEMNKHPEIDGIMQYEYLLHSVRASKRFSKWAKQKEQEDILAISKYYKINPRKAQEYKKLLSQEKIQEIIAFINNS